jgi:hypothetical protein
MSLTSSDTMLDFTHLSHSLNEICSICDLEGTADCVKSKCLNGFSRIVIDFYKAKGILNISGAETLIPSNDFKTYDKDLLTTAIADTCKLCRQCRDNHADNCVISLVRNSMEYAFWGESIPYPGNIFEYLDLVRGKDTEVAHYIMENYRKKNNSPK